MNYLWSETAESLSKSLSTSYLLPCLSENISTLHPRGQYEVLNVYGALGVQNWQHTLRCFIKLAEGNHSSLNGERQMAYICNSIQGRWQRKFSICRSDQWQGSLCPFPASGCIRQQCEKVKMGTSAFESGRICNYPVVYFEVISKPDRPGCVCHWV